MADLRAAQKSLQRVLSRAQAEAAVSPVLAEATPGHLSMGAEEQEASTQSAAALLEAQAALQTAAQECERMREAARQAQRQRQEICSNQEELRHMIQEV